MAGNSEKKKLKKTCSGIEPENKGDLPPKRVRNLLGFFPCVLP
jgi:hypothetical protein